MRTIPENIKTLLNKQQGIQPIFVIGIDWDGGGEVLYSVQEFTSSVGEVYSYVQSFENFNFANHAEGIGEVSSIDIVFNDSFGHFKEKIDTLDVYDRTTVCTLYLGIFGQEDIVSLFEGYLEDDIIWDEATQTLSATVVSDDLDKRVGYTPSITDIDEDDPDHSYYKDFLNTQAWPHIFGKVRNYEAIKVAERMEVKTTETVDYQNGNYNSYVFTVDEDKFPKNTPMELVLVGQTQAYFAFIVNGSFTESGGDIIFTTTSINQDWYDETDNIFYEETDSDENFGGASEGGSVITITENVWLEHMYLGLHYEHETLSGTVENTIHVKCIKQKGTTLVLNRQIRLPETPTTGSLYIKYARKHVENIYSVPSGSRLYDRSRSDRYILDLKTTEYTMLNLYMETADDLLEIPGSIYTLKTTDGEDTNALWQGSHHECTYIEFNVEIFMRFLEQYADKNIQEGIIVVGQSTLDTDKEVIEYLLSRYGGINTVNDSYPKSVNFPLLEEERLDDIVPEIAWQSNKVLRRTRDIATEVDLIYLRGTLEKIYTFNDSNVLQGSIKYTFTGIDNITTQFNLVIQRPDMMADIVEYIRRHNTDKYGEHTTDVDYYTFSVDNAIEHFDYWAARMSTIRRVVRFTSFLNAFGLEVWDVVYIDFSDPLFYDPDKGLPISNVHTGSTVPWSGYGFIKGLNMDIAQGLVDVEVEIIPETLTLVDSLNGNKTYTTTFVDREESS